MQNPFDFTVLGSGLSGLMLAYQMSQDSYFSDKRIAIIDKDIKNQNDRTWCFWASPEHEFSDIISKKWDKALVANQQFKQSFDLKPYAYQMIRSQDFYHFTIEKIKEKNNFIFIQDDILTIDEKSNAVTLVGKKDIHRTKKLFSSVFDVNSLKNQKKYAYLKQHFVGWFIKTKENNFNENELHFMDFDISQNGNTRFMYVLPLSKNEALFEYTLFSENLLKYDDYETEIINYLTSKNITDYTITEKEQGNIPMTCFPFHQKNSPNILYIGTAGGWTKASTGFTFSMTRKHVNNLINYIKSDKPFNRFYQQSRFWLYDLIFLEVLNNNNHRGAEIFSRLFQKNKTKTILDFLDEKTTVFQEIKLFLSLPQRLFVKNTFISIFKILKIKLLN